MLKKLSVFVLFLSISYTPLTTFAADTSSVTEHHGDMSMMKEPSPDMRKKMADAHQKMADCLKSTRPIADCKKDMMNDCPMMKSGKCMMMEGSMDGMKMPTHKKKLEGSPSDDHSEHHPDTE
jgi:hypothetical protein